MQKLSELRKIIPILLGLVIFALVFGFVPNKLALEVRQAYKTNTINAQQTNLEHRPLDTISNFVRKPLQKNIIHEADSAPSLDESSANFLAQSFSLDRSSLLQNIKLTTYNLPLGLSLARNLKTNSNLLACLPKAPTLETYYLFDKTSNVPFKIIVDELCTKYKLNPYLIYAIMHSESGFNPNAISNRFAHGLMQIVPETAGGEVHTYLHGKSAGLPQSSALLKPELNIKYGIVYLHLLMKRHLSGIDDPLAREYCTIAAYNMGSNAMLKIFGTTRKEAFKNINKFKADELYAHLLNNLPTTETRKFLQKVVMTKSSLNLQAYK